MSVDTALRTRRPPRSGMVGSSQGSRWWLYVLLTVALVAVIAPFVWMVLGSFKGEGELRQVPPTWLPESASLDNYTQLFSKLNFEIHQVRLRKPLYSLMVFTFKEFTPTSSIKMRFISIMYISSLKTNWYALSTKTTEDFMQGQ